MSPTPPASPLTAAAVTAVRRGVQAALDAPSGLSDAERVDAIRALEELVCTVTAAQASLSAELANSVEADHEALAVPARRRGQGAAAMVALARRESPRRGQQHLALARVVREELPHTWAAWRAGRITQWRATLIARETACLTREDRLAVDAAVAADPDALEAMSDRQAAQTAQAEGARLDAAAHVARRRRAESERRVSIRPAPDTMVWLTALMPVADGVATYAGLVAEADTARAAGDPRTRGQVMADTLRDRVTGAGAPHTTGPAAHPVAHPVALHLVMPHETLLGTSEDPCRLGDLGPIPAELARELVAGALDADQEVTLRRLYAAPDTGELITMDSRARRFPGNLRRFIRLRDQTCRTPWCDAPIRHVDHAVDHDTGGPTSAINGQGLCEACNYAKQAPRWRAGPTGDGAVATTTPTGHTHRTRPPPLVTIRRRAVAPLRVEYVLAG